jgi:MFS family permease
MPGDVEESTMSEASTPTTAADDPLWRRRGMLLASMIVVLAALGLLVSMHHTNWSWSLFFWGIVIGLAGLAVIATMSGLVSRRQGITADQRLRLRRRVTIYAFCWIAAGLTCGSIAAAFDQPWIDIAVAAYVAVTLGAGGLLVYRRRDSLGHFQ